MTEGGKLFTEVIASSIAKMATNDTYNAKRYKVEHDNLLLLKENNHAELNLCSTCNTHFERVEDYQWTCGTELQECSHWCDREWCTDTKMRLCENCEYAVCPECATNCICGMLLCANEPCLDEHKDCALPEVEAE